MRKNGVLTYLHAAPKGHPLGSTVLETNITVTVTTDEKYLAFGKQRDSGKVSTDHRFTGQKEDTSGLQYFNSRFYDPQTGMFVSLDTIVPQPGLASDYNRYMYVRGRVMNAADPSGHACYISAMAGSLVDGVGGCGGGSGLSPAGVAGAIVLGGAGGTAAAVIVGNLNSDQGEKVTPTAPPTLGPQPKPATQTGTQTWLPLSNGMDISVPGTNATEGNGWIDPGFTQGLQSPEDNVYNANSGYTRSDHAQDGANEKGRPVGTAYPDARNARQADIYIQSDGRYVVRGPKAREHIFSIKGSNVRHITTITNRSADAHARIVRNGERTPVTEEQYDDFMKHFKK